jgi:flavin-dependent dehydrogenase
MRNVSRPPIVVGASVAGLYAAYRLASAGHRVRVFEAQSEYSPDPRTLIVTPAWLELLDFDPGPSVLNRTRVFELISRGTSVRIPLQEPDVVMEREAFLRLLGRRVRGAGGDISLGHRFTGLACDGASPVLCFRNGAGEGVLAAPIVLGADGVRSRVAREVGVDGREQVAIRQARVPLPSDQEADTVRCWFDPSSTRFFFWLIPESSQMGVVGLIADSPAQAEQALERFVAQHNLHPVAYEAAQVPLHGRGPSDRALGQGGRVLLLGDAAGQVKVTTVGGMVAGMRGAAAAVRSVVHGTSYRAELRPLRRELDAHALVRGILDHFTDDDYDLLLRRLNRSALRVLSRYSRDELTRAVWRLILGQPGWLGLGARALLRGFAGSLTGSNGAQT